MLSQQKAVADFCIGAGIAIDEAVTEVGGGLNLKRKQFVRIMELVEARAVHTLVIAHKDRLARFVWIGLSIILNNTDVSWLS